MENRFSKSADVIPFPKAKTDSLERATVLIKTLTDAAVHFNATKPSISRQLEMIRDNLTQARVDVADPKERQHLKQTLNNKFFGALMGKPSASAHTELPKIEPALLKELAVRIAAAVKALTDCGYFDTENVVVDFHQGKDKKVTYDPNDPIFSAP